MPAVPGPTRRHAETPPPTYDDALVLPAEALYIHTPFCVRKCPYCDFFKVARPDPIARADAPGLDRMPSGADYLAALRAEAGARAPLGPAPRTIFIGGGTPSALTEDELRELMAIVCDRFDLSRVEEWTVEANPNSLTRAKAQILADAGVNRLSIGAQSFDPVALRFLGRAHRVDDIGAAIANAQAAGITRLSLDLIAAIGPASGVEEPARTQADLEQILTRPDLAALEHVSVYTLVIEQGTPFAARAARGEAVAADPDIEAACYELIHNQLTAPPSGRAQAGHPAAPFRRYEVSNFARPGAECQHNMGYWRCAPYIGLGPSAHGFDGIRRRANVRDLAKYVTGWQDGRPGEGAAPVPFEEERLSARQVLTERLLMGLRLADGVSLGDAIERAIEVAAADGERMAPWERVRAEAVGWVGPLVDAGFLRWAPSSGGGGSQLAPTVPGMALADRLALELTRAFEAVLDAAPGWTIS